MELSEFKRIMLYVVSIVLLLIVCVVVGPYILKSTISVWSGSDYHVLVVGDFNPQSPTSSSEMKSGFYVAMHARANTGFQFIPDFVNIDESVVDQINGPSETDTRNLNDEVKNQLIDKIARENVVAIVAANSSQTVAACLETGKMFHIPVLVTSATETNCLNGFESIGFRLVTNNHNQVPQIAHWVNQMTDQESQFKMGITKDSLWHNAFDSVMHHPFPDSYATCLNPAPDTCQMKKIDSIVEQKIKESKCAEKGEIHTVGILYLANKYGNDLCKEIKDSLHKVKYNVISFPISNTNSIIYAMQQTKEKLGISKWIAICYPDEAENIVAMEDRQQEIENRQKKAAVGSKNNPLADKILFTEASYGQWMSYHDKDSNLYAMHSDNYRLWPVSHSYFSQVAEDAYDILEYCLSDIKTTAKTDLIKNLIAFPSSTPDKYWDGEYAFYKGTGENLMSQPSYQSFDSLSFSQPDINH
jgi:hypothetical protein